MRKPKYLTLQSIHHTHYILSANTLFTIHEGTSSYKQSEITLASHVKNIPTPTFCLAVAARRENTYKQAVPEGIMLLTFKRASGIM
jgi:hypothetical protein